MKLDIYPPRENALYWNYCTHGLEHLFLVAKLIILTTPLLLQMLAKMHRAMVRCV